MPGTNMVRLKVWVNPADGYNTTNQVVATAKRVKAAGMKVLIDFHYCDRWTDPGAQGIPAAWAGLTRRSWPMPCTPTPSRC